MRMLPERSPPPPPPPPPPPFSSSSPQAATLSAMTPAAASASQFLMRCPLCSIMMVAARLPALCMQSVADLSPRCEKDVKRPRTGPRSRDAGNGALDRLGLEAIAEAEVGMDEAAPRQDLVELLPQLAHVHVHGAVRAPVGLAPYGHVELLPAHDAPGALHQRGEQLQLAGGQVQRTPGHRGHELPRPHLQLPGAQLL